MEIFSLLLLLSFMTSLAALGAQTHQRPTGFANGKSSFTRLGEGTPGLVSRESPGQTPARLISSGIPPLAGPGMTERAHGHSSSTRRDFLLIPNSYASIYAPKPGKFYILSKTFFFFSFPFLILPVVTLDILVLRIKVKSLFESC